MFCRLVVVGRCILIDFDRYLLCFCDHCVRLCVVFFIGSMQLVFIPCIHPMYDRVSLKIIKIINNKHHQ